MGRAFALTIMMNLKRDNGQKIEAAFELLRKQDLETFDIPCVCAIHDQPYKLRFKRKPSGLFGLIESVRNDSVTTTSSSSHVRATLIQPATLLLNQLEPCALPCAWCGDGSFHHCAQNCGALVCGGRMKGDTFHCRPSCGASWIGVPLDKVEGEKRQELQRPSMPPRPRSPTTPLVSEPKFLLTAGQSLLVRRK